MRFIKNLIKTAAGLSGDKMDKQLREAVTNFKKNPEDGAARVRQLGLALQTQQVDHIANSIQSGDLLGVDDQSLLKLAIAATKAFFDRHPDINYNAQDHTKPRLISSTGYRDGLPFEARTLCSNHYDPQQPLALLQELSSFLFDFEKFVKRNAAEKVENFAIKFCKGTNYTAISAWPYRRETEEEFKNRQERNRIRREQKRASRERKKERESKEKEEKERQEYLRLKEKFDS